MEFILFPKGIRFAGGRMYPFYRLRSAALCLFETGFPGLHRLLFGRSGNGFLRFGGLGFLFDGIEPLSSPSIRTAIHIQALRRNVSVQPPNELPRFHS